MEKTLTELAFILEKKGFSVSWVFENGEYSLSISKIFRFDKTKMSDIIDSNSVETNALMLQSIIFEDFSSLQDNALTDFMNLDKVERFRILVSKFWLTHTNDQVFDTFGFNFVPTLEYQ